MSKRWIAVVFPASAAPVMSFTGKREDMGKRQKAIHIIIRASIRRRIERNRMAVFAHPFVPTALLLTASNVFMTFAWYGHLKHLNAKPWWIAALVSWGIALLEYLIQVPANRIGFSVFSLAQLKILQEVITLLVFVPFAVLYMKQEVSADYVYAGICLLGAVYFIFRG
jgi:uncharacterized protein (DUF486 family)